jgi:hypothetical protein
MIMLLVQGALAGSPYFVKAKDLLGYMSSYAWEDSYLKYMKTCKIKEE